MIDSDSPSHRPEFDVDILSTAQPPNMARSTHVRDALVVVAAVWLASSALVGAVPVPRYRGAYTLDRRADATRERRAPYQHRQRVNQHFSGGFKRDASLKDAENWATCPYEVRTDYHEHRIPRLIQHGVCKETNCKCGSAGGDYACTQLLSELEVAHLSTTGEIVSKQKVQVKYGCVCATRTGVHGNRAEEPKLPT